MTDATLLLVHGAWHGAWAWARVVDELRARGVAARTVDLPSCGTDPARLGGLHDDAGAVARAAAAIDGPVVVVAHSYGGMPVTAAEYDSNVVRLVYLAAFMPEEDTPLAAFYTSRPGYLEVLPGRLARRVTPAARDVFYSDCASADAEDAVGRLVLHSVAAAVTPPGRCAWRALPTTYIVCTRDRAIDVAIQESFAARADHRAALDSGHTPMLSRPAELADLLAPAVVGWCRRR